jgi:ADP-ribose pyrophosphatase
MDRDPAANASVPAPERRRVFENSRFTIYSDRVTGRGREIVDYLVVKPHSSRSGQVAGIAVIPVRDRRILLLRHYRHAVSSHVRELPRGFVDAGEDAESAALRELAEETGLRCSREKLVHLGTFMPEPGVIDARVALFAALDCHSGADIHNDDIGIDGWDWVSVEEVRRMLDDGELQDGSTCVALHRYFAAREDRRIT